MPQSITISPTLEAVAPGSVLQLTATGHYADGSTRDVTSAVVWASTDAAVAVITNGSAGGLLTAGNAQGTCNVSATLGIVSDTVPMTIPASALFHAAWAAQPTGLGATPDVGGRVYVFSEFVPPDVTTLNVQIANRIAQGGGALPALTANVAVYQSDGTGEPTGAAFAVFNAQVIPGDSSFLSVGPFPGIVRGSDGKVVVLIGMDQGEQPTFASDCWIGFSFAGTSAVSPAPSPLSVLGVGVTTAYLEYNTAARHLVVLGDSIAVGYDPSAVLTWSETAFQLIAQDRVWAVDATGVPGYGSLQHFADFVGNPNLWDGSTFTGAAVCIDLGTNDLAYNDLATMQTALQAIIAHLQTLGVAEIYGATVPPQAAYPGTDVTRAAYNTWIKANFVALGLTAVRDRAAAQNVGGLADNADPNVLYAGYALADGTHINAAGNQQERVGWEAVL